MTDLDDREAGRRRGSAQGAPRMRASDADRHTAVMALQDAMARGLLTPDEASERMGIAFATVYLEDLGVLTVDLPPGKPASGGAPGWAAVGTLAVEQLRASLTGSGGGRLDPARVVAVLLLMTMLAVAFGVIAAGLFDAGYQPEPGAFGRH